MLDSQEVSGHARSAERSAAVALSPLPVLTPASVDARCFVPSCQTRLVVNIDDVRNSDPIMAEK